MKIVLLESLGVPEPALTAAITPFLEQGHSWISYERTTDEELLVRECEGAEAVILANMPFPDTVIRRLPDLRFIDVAFTGVDHVGLQAAREQGITVSNASGYSTQAVAELAIGMMLSLLRHLPEQEAACRALGTRIGIGGRELGGKTVGIVGTGKIGLRTAAILRAMGCRVIGTSRTCREGLRDGIEHMPLMDLLAASDIVVLHCPLNDSTRGMIDAKALQTMKKRAILINVARGPVVDAWALREALDQGRIAGAGIDVFDQEPPLRGDDPLLNAPNTILTPHTAFATEESMLARLDIVFENLSAYIAGTPVHLV